MFGFFFCGVGQIGGVPGYYHNGHRAYIQRYIKPATLGLSASLGRPVLPLIITDLALKLVAYGGQVESPDGWDVRFELADRTRLYHEDVAFDGVAGRKAVWLGLPIAHDRPLDLRIYCGNPLVTAPQADPIKCWAGVLASIDLSTGTDQSGNGANLELIAVASDTLAGMPAGRYSENATDVDLIATDDGDVLVTDGGDTLMVG